MLAASLLHVRRLPGVYRPGIAIVIPGRRGPTVLIDAGANADGRPEHLVQFAHMGAVFAQELLDVPDPAVRLLSIGEEAEKGNQLTLETHALLEDGVEFRDLGLVVIDEQHRFGVGQRLDLVVKGHAVDVLLTTATPIPRSLVLAAYGDLASSQLVAKPPGRSQS